MITVILYTESVQDAIHNKKVPRSDIIAKLYYKTIIKMFTVYCILYFCIVQCSLDIFPLLREWANIYIELKTLLTADLLFL